MCVAVCFRRRPLRESRQRDRGRLRWSGVQWPTSINRRSCAGARTTSGSHAIQAPSILRQACATRSRWKTQRDIGDARASVVVSHRRNQATYRRRWPTPSDGLVLRGCAAAVPILARGPRVLFVVRSIGNGLLAPVTPLSEPPRHQNGVCSEEVLTSQPLR